MQYKLGIQSISYRTLCIRKRKRSGFCRIKKKHLQLFVWGKTIFRTCHLIDVKRKQSQETKLKYQHVVERDCTKDTNEKDWNLFS